MARNGDSQKKRKKKYVPPKLTVYGSIMHLGLEQVAASSSRTRKKDIQLLSKDDCSGILSKLRSTPVYRFRYKKESATQKPHLGVIAEEAPDEITDEKRQSVMLASTMGFMMAAIKALAVQQQTLMDRLDKNLAK
jgi:hypothetical protein